jgi:hypothetical protein
MKLINFVLGLLLLFSLMLPMAPAASASVDAICVADPSSIGPYETTTITCAGFDANTYIATYFVEPDGTAVAFGSYKSNASGVVSFTFTNGEFPYVTLSLGTYTFVTEQLGLGGAKVRQGTTQVTVTGGKEGVSGASLTTNATVYHPGDTVILTGNGFAPNEFVTIWQNIPTPCSSYTRHYTDANNGATFENVPNFASFGTFALVTVKASASGSFVFTDTAPTAEPCKGLSSYVAHGNSSGLGATAEFTYAGNPITTNASLVPSKSTVNAFNDTITFFASGFGANEILNCWTTSPEGRAFPFGSFGSFQPGPKMGANGTGVISLTTGSHIITPDDPFFHGQTVEPLMSEGSLGVWAMTCRGIASGTYAIATYTVTGGPLDP